MSNSNVIKILMVDDHPSMLDGYKLILSYNSLGHEILTTTAHNCESAFNIIQNPAKKNYFDFVFLDYSLPPFKEMNILNGEDLAQLVKKHSPKSKIAILTSHAEALLLYGIVQNIDPMGLLVKSDFSADELIKAYAMMLEGDLYYSSTVKKVLKDMLLPEKYLGKQNRELLKLLACGHKNKHLIELLNISRSAVQKRKNQIKIYLNLKVASEEEILKEAKKRGLI